MIQLSLTPSLKYRAALLCVAFSIAFLSLIQASPEIAKKIESQHQLETNAWLLAMKSATTPAQQEKLLQSQPNTAAAIQKMWLTISPDAAQRWTLPHMAWCLRLIASATPQNNSQPATLFIKESQAILDSIEKHHLLDPSLTSICTALTNLPNPKSLATLNHIEQKNPDPKIQGIAALSSAIILKTFGSDAELTRKRLTFLRKAIIQSADVDLNGTKVSKVVEDELYIIRNLENGRVAPDLIGMDSAGRPLKLSEQTDQVTILFFWNSQMQEYARSLDMMRELQQKFRDKPLKIIGVNHDSIDRLRSLEADGSMSWKNFSDPSQKLANDYKVGYLPLVFVMDQKRKIHYSGTPGSFIELTVEALLAETNLPTSPKSPSR